MSKDRTAIRFSGSARQVETAFHTELHNLSVKGVQHFSNMTDPQISDGAGAGCCGAQGSEQFHSASASPLGSKVTLDKDTGLRKRVGQSQPPATQATGIRPEIGFSCGSGCLIEDLTPYDFAAIYNVAPLWTSGIDGTGQTIGIVGRSDVRSADVSSFRTTFGLSGGAFNVVHNGPDPGYCTAANYTSTIFCVLDDQIENALDVEWSGAIAPKATVNLVVTQQTATNDAIYESANYIIQNNVAKIINVSYGNCELFMGTSGNASYNSLWQTAATGGISVFVATGDSGSPACDQGGDSSGVPYAAEYGLAVSGLASTPFNTAVGGTDFNWGTTASPYWNATNNSTNGSTAKGYIPETPWNDTCTNPLVLPFLQSVATYLQNEGFSVTSPTNAESACNFVVNVAPTFYSLYGEDISSLVDTVGAGGGASNCTTNSTTDATVNPDPTSCTGGYSKPTWQAGVSGIPSDGKRDMPDVVFFAGNGFNGSAYLVCVSDWGACVTTPYPANEPTDAQGNSINEIGGTSAASPAMAGVMSLINQKAGSAQGSPNSELYTLAAKQTYASCETETVTNSSSCYFNDIDTNTIAMPCASGSPNCTVSTTGDVVGVLSGFGAGTGFDNATGLGSLNVANVVNGWTASAPIGTAPSTVTVTPAATAINSGQSLNVTATVAGAGATPTGSVTLSGGGYTSPAQTLASGTATIAIPANSLSAGADALTVNYSGDSYYGTASGTGSVTVTQSTYTLAATTPAAINRGSSATSTVTWTTTNDYSANVTVSSCTLNSGPPANSAPDTPKCTGSSTGFGASGSSTVTVTTTAATTTSALQKPHIGGWGEAGGGAVLALLVFFGIPARRRGWRAMVGMLVILFALGGLAACGGGGGGGGGSSDPGTASGTYTFTVKSTGGDPAKTTGSTTFTVTVN